MWDWWRKEWKRQADRWKFDKIADTVYFMVEVLDKKEIQRVLICVDTRDLYIALQLKESMKAKDIDTDDIMGHTDIGIFNEKDFR